ncbi:MAG: endolytic transglycosylase MltG [Clostridia bacterium]|nr:endolytic transglycosylase MltG [Clostridia bacterium]
MHDHRPSQNEELEEILAEYRKKKKEQPEGRQPTPHTETRVVEAKTRVELPKEKPAPVEETEEIGISEDAVKNHFADSVSEEDMGLSSHFSESDGDEPPLPAEEPDLPAEEEEDEEDEEDEDELQLPLPLRILRKLWRGVAGMSFLLKAALYIVIVLIIAAYLSYYVLTIGNDVFALVKGDAEITVTLSEDATQEEVAQILYENGLIEYDWVFSIYLQYSGDGEEIAFIPGEHKLNVSMNYIQLLAALTTPVREREVVTLTIPEGFTVDDIINLFVKNGVGTKEGFIEAINNYPYKHEFVKILDENGWDADRVYRLEGYLYPDTYDFYTDTEEYLAINKLLNNFNAKVWVDWKSTYASICEGKGYTLDDIVTLASMIEAEGKTAEDFEYISYVFHNRLNHKADYPLLESDATIQYALELAGMDRIQDASQIDKSFPSPYNTYTNEGLPPGAICNAGLDSILSAIYPSPPYDEDGDVINAFFFVSNDLGETYYAATLSGHLKNVERVRKENAALKAENEENE